jgi:hypothetical protein
LRVWCNGVVASITSISEIMPASFALRTTRRSNPGSDNATIPRFKVGWPSSMTNGNQIKNKKYIVTAVPSRPRNQSQRTRARPTSSSDPASATSAGPAVRRNANASAAHNSAASFQRGSNRWIGDGRHSGKSNARVMATTLQASYR